MPERSRHLSLEQAIEQVTSAGGFLLGLDFDGTLAPIVDHPDDAVSDRRALTVIRSLAGRTDVEVAVVSGRAFADLRQRLGEVPGATLIGEHGNDTGGEAIQDPLMSQAELMVKGMAEEAGGATVEVKQRSVTFHYRNLDEGRAEKYLGLIRIWAGEHDVEVLEGKKVIELTTARRTKGDAIRDLAAGRRVVYVGDDVTDETVFEILGPRDVGVKVGEGPTSASYRVKDIDGVVTVLEQIALASG